MPSPAGHDVAASIQDALVERALERTPTAEDELRVIAELRDVAGDRRDALIAAQQEFRRRLLDRSDDFDATNALRLVTRALAGMARPVGSWGWLDGERRGRGRPMR